MCKKRGNPMYRVDLFAAAHGGVEAPWQQLLDHSHQWESHDRDGDARGGHGSFCTTGYIELQRALCLALVQDHQRAINQYEQALPALPPVYRRDRAAALAGKAAAHAAAGQPDQAAATAREALSIARRAGSQRIVQRISAVGATLRPYRRLEDVATLLHELNQAG